MSKLIKTISYWALLLKILWQGLAANSPVNIRLNMQFIETNATKAFFPDFSNIGHA